MDYLINNFENITLNNFNIVDNMVYFSSNISNVINNLVNYKIMYPEKFTKNKLKYYPVINVKILFNLLEFPLDLVEIFIQTIHEFLGYNSNDTELFKHTVCLNKDDLIKYTSISLTSINFLTNSII